MFPWSRGVFGLLFAGLLANYVPFGGPLVPRIKLLAQLIHGPDYKIQGRSCNELAVVWKWRVLVSRDFPSPYGPFQSVHRYKRIPSVNLRQKAYLCDSAGQGFLMGVIPFQ